MYRLPRILLLVLLALLGCACARGPDSAGLEQDVQARLDALFGRPVLVLKALRRQGSAPLVAAGDGTRQAIVYYNAVLEFAEAYDPSDWEGLSPQVIASALGATDAGVVGFGSDRMAPGAELRAYGSLIYRRDGDRWRVTDLQAGWTPAQRPVGATARSRADELIERLSQVMAASPRSGETTDQIVAEELDRALQRIQLQLDTGSRRIVVATGPAGGEYARFMASLQRRLAQPEVLAVATTSGSVDNAFLVEQGKARFGLVQSDVAAAAVTGQGLFAATGPLRNLRAVASLFPEPLHVVVRGDSGFQAVRDLAGRRVSLGAIGSGSRHTAVKVLEAHGLSAGDYVEVAVVGPHEALERLATGEVDAVIEVVSAPWGRLTEWLTRTSLRLLPLDAEAIGRAQQAMPGVVPLTLAAHTYRGQGAAVPTVAATALLVVSNDTPDRLVAAALESMYAASAAPGVGARGARLSAERASIGVTIPLHDGAVGYFEQHRVETAEQIESIDR